jgi:hypothetical protein
VSHLIYSLSVGKAMPIDHVDSSADLMSLIQSMPISRASASLWFCTSLAEEVGKTDANNIKQ